MYHSQRLLQLRPQRREIDDDLNSNYWRYRNVNIIRLTDPTFGTIAYKPTKKLNINRKIYHPRTVPPVIATSITKAEARNDEIDVIDLTTPVPSDTNDSHNEDNVSTPPRTPPLFPIYRKHVLIKKRNPVLHYRPSPPDYTSSHSTEEEEDNDERKSNSTTLDDHQVFTPKFSENNRSLWDESIHFGILPAVPSITSHPTPTEPPSSNNNSDSTYTPNHSDYESTSATENTNEPDRRTFSSDSEDTTVAYTLPEQLPAFYEEIQAFQEYQPRNPPTVAYVDLHDRNNRPFFPTANRTYHFSDVYIRRCSTTIVRSPSTQGDPHLLHQVKADYQHPAYSLHYPYLVHSLLHQYLVHSPHNQYHLYYPHYQYYHPLYRQLAKYYTVGDYTGATTLLRNAVFFVILTTRPPLQSYRLLRSTSGIRTTPKRLQYFMYMA